MPSNDHRSVPAARRVAVHALASVVGLSLPLTLVGCGESPDPADARRPADASSSSADGTPAPAGGSRSTLGRARDRAESVIEDVKEYDQRRMDMIDEMNGVTPAGGEGERENQGEDDGES